MEDFPERCQTQTRPVTTQWSMTRAARRVMMGKAKRFGESMNDEAANLQTLCSLTSQCGKVHPGWTMVVRPSHHPGWTMIVGPSLVCPRFRMRRLARVAPNTGAARVNCTANNFKMYNYDFTLSL